MTMDVIKCHGGGLDVSIECPAGSCQHHGSQYAEWGAPTSTSAVTTKYESKANGATIVQVSITTTKRCCITVMSAIAMPSGFSESSYEIERPLATIRTTQEDSVTTIDTMLIHHAAWEVLDAGTYTYYLVNRSGASRIVYSAWIKAVASDCEG